MSILSLNTPHYILIINYRVLNTITQKINFKNITLGFRLLITSIISFDSISSANHLAITAKIMVKAQSHDSK